MIGKLLAAFIAVNADVPLGTNGVSDTARFVKTFECRDAQAVYKAIWTVTGLGVFRTYLNGQEVGAADCLKPGLTHVAKRRNSLVMSQSLVRAMSEKSAEMPVDTAYNGIRECDLWLNAA